MAKTPTETNGEAPVRKRRVMSPPKPKPLFMILSVVDGKPVVEAASFKAEDVLNAYGEAANAGRVPTLYQHLIEPQRRAAAASE